MFRRLIVPIGLCAVVAFAPVLAGDASHKCTMPVQEDRKSVV